MLISLETIGYILYSGLGLLILSYLLLVASLVQKQPVYEYGDEGAYEEEAEDFEDEEPKSKSYSFIDKHQHSNEQEEAFVRPAAKAKEPKIIEDKYQYTFKSDVDEETLNKYTDSMDVEDEYESEFKFINSLSSQNNMYDDIDLSLEDENAFIFDEEEEVKTESGKIKIKRYEEDAEEEDIEEVMLNKIEAYRNRFKK